MKKKKNWQTLSVSIEGQKKEDILIALEEVLKQVKKGCSSGFDSNDTGNYDFNIKKGE